ncbi:MAG: AsmA-like C-terminal region-containing protein [Verrucomicrobiota bacterium]
MKRIGMGVGGVLGVAVLVLFVLVVFQVPISLNRMKPEVLEAARERLDRDVAIEGGVSLVLGLRPALEVRGFRIGNPEGWPGGGDLARLDRVRARVGLTDFLNGDLDIYELVAEGMYLALEKNVKGEENWNFPEAESGEEEAAGSGNLRIVGFDKVLIRDLTIKAHKVSGERDLDLRFEEVKGTAEPGDPLTLELGGAIQSVPFSVSVKGESIGKLVAWKEPWKFELDGKLEGMSMKLTGDLASKDEGQGSVVHFVVNVDDFSGLRKLEDSIPDFGTAQVSGAIESHPSGHRIPHFLGKLGAHEISGSLVVDLTEDVPRLEGNLDLPVLDLASDGGGGEDSEGVSDKEATEAGSGEKREDEEVVDFPVTGTLALSIGEIRGVPLALEKLEVGLTMAKRSVRGDIHVAVGGDVFRGKVDYERLGAGKRAWGLSLEGRDVDVGGMVDAFADIGMRGTAKAIAVSLGGEGEELASLWKQRSLSIEGTDLRVGIGDEGEDIVAERARLTRPAGEPLRVDAMGAVGEEAVTFGMVYRGREAAKAGGEAMIELNGTVGGAAISLKRDAVPAEGDGEARPVFRMEASGERAGDLSGLTGISRFAEMGYGLAGEMTFGKEAWELKGLKGNIGGTDFSGAVGMVRGGDGVERYDVDLEFGTVDGPEIVTLFSRKASRRVVVAQVIGGEDKKKDEAGNGGVDLDRTILPSQLNLGDATVKLRAGTVQLEKGKVSEVEVAAQVSEGKLEDAPFSFVFEEEEYTGDVTADFRGEQPALDFQLSAATVDVAGLLEELGLAELPGFTTDRFDVDLKMRGATLREILLGSSVAGKFGKGEWVLRTGGRRGKAVVLIDDGTIDLKPGEKLEFSLNGHVGDDVLAMRFESDGLDAIAAGKERLTARLDWELPGTTIGLEFDVALPLDREDIAGEMKVDTRSLSDLSDLFDLDLPPLSPFRMKSYFDFVATGYALEDIDLTVGGSGLTGKLAVDTGGERPRVTADLVSAQLQLNDFVKEDWSPVGPNTGGDSAEVTSTKIIDGAQQQLAEVFSAAVLGSLDADVSLDARDVRSGRDALGRGRMTVKVSGGAMTVDPMDLNLPGGDLQLSLFFHPEKGREETRVEVKCQDFDYGVLARREDPSSEAKGKLNIDAKLRAVAPEPGRFSAHASGYINFSVCPERLSAGVFDFWATNVITALIPRLDPERASKLNCIVGEMLMSDGIMTPKSFIIDATRVRAQAGGTINFRTETVDMEVVPQAKRPQILNLNTPIRIDGTFQDFSGRVTAVGAFQSLTGAATRTLSWPLRVFTAERLPEDGSDVCPCVRR